MNALTKHLKAIGRLGGKGRAKKLSAKRRTEIARTAARARWGTKKKGSPHAR